METKEFESYVKAGKIAAQIKVFMKDFVRRGMKLIDIAEGIEKKIRELGGEPAFPVNTSLDEIAAHYTPTLGDDTIAAGLLKVDVGVCVNGFIADFARSFDLSEEGEHTLMLKLNEELLKKAKKIVKSEIVVSDIGNALGDFLDRFNIEHKTSYSVIGNLCGHTLGENNIHAGTTIPNNRNDSKVLLSGAFAVEPFVTTGAGHVYEGEGGGIYVLVSERNARDKDVREVLKFIWDEYSGRPFCARWLEKAGFKRFRFALKNLVQEGILYHYPLLIEKSKVPVSQFEDSFLIDGEKAICFSD